jgi:hypothetical protein|tara:strand:+ start:1261 stop:1713 length:453 start_codon:yes stop_codon:yes gene_type:complete
MAKEDNAAFNAMNKVSPDNDITGGAIMYSEFEMDMTPTQQKKYRDTLLNTLDSSYRGDPHKGKLGFADWLDNLNPELIKERALKWEEVRHDRDVMNEMNPDEFSLLEDAGFLEGLLQKHTGRLEDVRDVIGSDLPRPIEEFTISSGEYRK